LVYVEFALESWLIREKFLGSENPVGRIEIPDFLIFHFTFYTCNMDPISNMLTTVRNSLAVNKDFCVLPFSKINFEIARVLKENKFIRNFEKEIGTDEKFQKIKISLKYDVDLNPAINEIKRTSKLGRRVYTGYDDIRIPRFGISILSTPQGIMTSAQAKRKKIGGEIICFVR